MELPKIKRTTLVDKIVEILIGKINNNEFNVGEILPSEIEMSAQFGVSRATIRESTSYLIGMGILERNENGLEIIQTPSTAILNNLKYFIDIGLETQALYEARIFFDIGFAYLASLKATDEDIEQLEKLNNNIVENLDNKEQYWETDLEFHYEIARIANNDFLYSVYETIMQLFTVEFTNSNNNIFNQSEVVNNTPKTHTNLLETFRTGNSLEAINIMLKSLGKAKEDMIGRRIRQAIPTESDSK
ncbi:FCD domain-containing protein [Tissierella sp. Yu-01]|uniref:FadR/GntR family transcriptional regulator n=1 Tax=Tissierella sp. Yu-01 TaxID=3035694 RepID=UPI00240E217E|nr:FCD domain-containing protein [Tissierella sp. Yu-01]WFA08573.1 FCD domain-containing protein [Tissierella sp. Yu-01]